MKASEFDQMFDENQQDIIEHLDLESEFRPGRPVQRVNVDFPTWMVVALDKEARRLGITRQSVIKTWIGDRLDRMADRSATTTPGT